MTLFHDPNRRAVVLPDILVEGTETLLGTIVCAPPGPTAIAGFAHRLERDLRASGEIAEADALEGAALVAHAFEIPVGHRKIPPDRPAESKEKAGKQVDAPEGFLRCSLVVCVATDDPQAVVRVSDFARRRLRAYRFGGGHVVRHGDPVPVPEADRLDAALRAVSRGFALADRSDLLESAPADQDPLARMLDLLALHAVPEKPQAEPDNASGETDAPEPSDPKVRKRGKKVPKAASADDGDEGESPKVAYRYVRREGAGWLTPVVVGWRPVTALAQRAGTRSGHDVLGHVFAEDVVSLAEWVPLRKALGASGPSVQQAPKVFWQYAFGPPEGPFLVAAS